MKIMVFNRMRFKKRGNYLDTESAKVVFFVEKKEEIDRYKLKINK